MTTLIVAVYVVTTELLGSVACLSAWQSSRWLVSYMPPMPRASLASTAHH